MAEPIDFKERGDEIKRKRVLRMLQAFVAALVPALGYAILMESGG